MGKLVQKFFLLILLTFTLCASHVGAEEQQFGDYTVNYVAVYSNFLRPEIAERYGIVRSARNAFVNISVLRNDSSVGTPVAARISGEKANFIGQSDAIEFIEIREGDAIYYIGQFEFSNAENLRFNLSVQPERQGPAYSVSWTTQMYIN
jgi:hypothetical protein